MLLGALLWSGVALGEQPISEQAKLYFGNGVELLQSSPPNYQDAYYQFKLAYKASNSWKVLGNLGLCALKLERDGEAFQYYTEYLQQGGNEIDPGERAALEREMLLITGNSAIVALTASAEGAELVVSRGGSSAPPQAYKFDGDKLDLRLRVGTHTLTASLPDGKRRTWEVAISPGQEVSHHFDFDSKEAPAAGSGDGQGSQDRRTRESGGELRVVGFVVTGVGAAALMGGAITGILAKNKEEEATSSCYPSIDQATGRSVQRCDDPNSESELKSAEDLARTTNYLLIGGGVLAAAGITMIIFGGPVESTASARLAPPRPSLRLQPQVGPRAAGLFATGTF